MIAEIYHIPNRSEVLQVKLGLPEPIDVIVFRADFTVSAFRASTYHEPAEGGELEIESCEVLHILCEGSETLVELTEEQKVIVDDHVDHKVLEEHLYDAYECNQEEEYDVY